jgi:methyl-accepting chemotaxis protein
MLKKINVKQRLHLAFILLFLIPSLSIGTISYNTAKEKVKEKVLQQAKGNVTLLNDIVNKTVEPNIRNVDLLSQTITATLYEGRQSPKVMRILHQFENVYPDISEAYVATETGFLLMDGAEKLPKEYDPRKRPWYQMAKQAKGKAAITNPYLDLVTGEVVVSIVQMTKDGSGVVGLDLNLKKLGETVKTVKIGQNGYAFIIDKMKRVVVHPYIKSGEAAPQKISTHLFQEKTGEYDNITTAKKEKTFYVTNALTGWKLAGTVDIKEAEKEAQPIFLTTAAVIALTLLLGGIVVYLIIASIIRPLQQLQLASERISEGDLTERVSIQSDDEIGQLGARFNKMSDSLQSVLHNVMEKAEKLASSSEQLLQGTQETNKAIEHISTTIQEIAAGSEHQVKTVEETSDTITKMSSTMQLIAHNAQSTSAAIAKTADIASNGNEAIQVAIQQMDIINEKVNMLAGTVKQLNERSQQIENFVDIITGIAEQTNLLSLNAAIEAARAGEHGQGFSVVANEVRKLAEQSSQSAQKITDLIAKVQTETAEAVKSMESGVKEVEKGRTAVYTARESFQSIHDSVEEVANQIHEVSASVQQISAGAEAVVHTIHTVMTIAEQSACGMQSVSASTEEQLASIEQIASAAASLTHMAEELDSMIHKFKL